ncbi:MAG TPA: glutathione S-transferase family protein [Caulobacteraceae bacterium]|nr:glutathione S-transferase family protein [Caulobacteraceae bacterium]
MTLTIYGSPRSRTLRVLWAAAELGLDYVHVPLAFDDPQLKSAAFLKLNPAGTIPTIDDDGFALSESLAINLYLAKTYGAGGLYPATDEGEARAWKWTLWAQGHLEPWVQGDVALAKLHAAIGEASRAVIEHALGLLDRTLDDRAWLVGDGFSIADLNVACVLSPSRVARLDLSPFGCVHDWLARCYGRPAAVATRTRFA